MINILTYHCLFLILLCFFAITIFGCSKNLDLIQPVKEPVKEEVSFQLNVKPILVDHGCATCHGGISGLTVTSVADLILGGDHGPAITPGHADSSNLARKISPVPPFGARMPFGGPYLSDTEIQIITDWINQGAKNN